MVSPVTAAGVGIIVVLHTAIAAVGARFFRVTLASRWGSVVYTALLVPIVYVATTLVLGAIGLGAGAFDDAGRLVVVTWAFPFFLGWSIDLFWIPPPEAYDLPERASK